MMDKIREVYEYRAFFRQLLYQQLRQRYQGSVLGFLWTLLNPLLIFVSFSVIFSILNNWDLKDYGIYFLSGYVAWNFFANSCLSAAESVVGHAPYVTKVYVPKAVFPLASVAVNLVDLLAGLAILFLIMVFVGAPFSLAMLFLPVSVFLLILFTTGAALLSAGWNVVFRDFRYLLSSLLFVWFFFTPILWKADQVKGKMAANYVQYNPTAWFVQLFQAPVWKGELPPAETVATAALIATFIFLAGVYSFLRSERTFFYYL